MKTSIIVCFYDKIPYLKYCLDSLISCQNDFDEVVIADDGSPDAAVQELKDYRTRYSFPIVHAWHPRDGARRAACRNNGIRQAAGDYLVFFDADFAILPGAVKSHVEAAKSGYFAAGRCKYMTEEQTNHIFSKGLSSDILKKIYGELSEDPIIREHREFVHYGILRRLYLTSARKQTFGGHFSIHKKSIESINGYDENYIGWGGEDLDLAMRLVMAGFKGISVIKSARILHLWHPKEIGDKHWHEGVNTEYFFRKKIPIFCENGLIKRPESGTI